MAQTIEQQLADHRLRVLIEEGAKDAARDVAFYRERIAATVVDGAGDIDFVRDGVRIWGALLTEAIAVERFCRKTLDAARFPEPDAVDLAKREAWTESELRFAHGDR